MRQVLCSALIFALYLSLTTLPGAAQEFDERFDDWPSDLTIGGQLVIVAELADVRLLAESLDAEALGQPGWLIEDTSSDEASGQSAASRSYGQVFDQLRSITPDDLPDLDSPTAPELIVWHVQSPAEYEQLGEQASVVTAWLARALKLKKTVIVSGIAARLAGKSYLAPTPNPQTMAGLNLLPDCLLDLDFQPAQVRRVLTRVAQQPRCVGIGLEPHNILILSGRKLLLLGTGHAWLLLPRNAWLPSRIETLSARRPGTVQRTTQWLADLTQWRREAIDRGLEKFPPDKPGPPRLSAGRLLIVGGGAMPEGLQERFIELAGGHQAARLVYIPCAEEETVPAEAGMLASWRAQGVAQVSLLHTKDRHQAHNDTDFLAPLAEATGIWFGGGRQWNFADSYYGTHAHRLMKQVLQRGGVIGGSSAGASIQARYLARATPIENVQIMAPGYERGGLGFLDGVAIDQHFSQRRRQADLASLVQRYPQLLGIGIDEGTALEVHESTAQVIGEGAVYFYDRRRPWADHQPEYLRLTAGENFDLVSGQPVPVVP